MRRNFTAVKSFARIVAALAFASACAAEPPKFPLPNPSEIGSEKFCEQLNAFLSGQGYARWEHDPAPHATGPLTIQADGTIKSLGTHGPSGVKVFYSPEVWKWLHAKQRGAIPDGAMIVKELFDRDEKNPAAFQPEFSAWSVMVKDSKGSWDGWFWTDGGPLQKPKPESAQRFFDMNAGFGLSCLNCHASVDNLESTFSSLKAARGEVHKHATNFPRILPKLKAGEDIHGAIDTSVPHRHKMSQKNEKAFWSAHANLLAGMEKAPAEFPFASFHDHVVQGPRPDGQKQFITSNQCAGCHNATKNFSVLPNMALEIAGDKNKRQVNLSPHGEWRYSMMGLSGRDPVFYAQLESERKLHPELAAEIDNKCLSCHAVMGQRQWAHDHGRDALFTHETIMQTAGKDAHYGALARDGVSCAVCHRMLPDGLGTPASYTGNFKLSDKPNEIFGPYNDPLTLPMEQSLGLTPKLGAHISESKMCGSCHSVLVPVLDVGKKITAAEFHNPKTVAHEQATYLEWKNSVFSTENPANKHGQSCQDCHMPRTYAGEKLRFRVANIQDESYPPVDHLPPLDKITMKVRGEKDRYSRHSLNGINLFVMEMFNQFPWELGVQKRDNLFPGSDVTGGFDFARETIIQFAQQQTATVEIKNLKRTESGIAADVQVANLTGHKFPTGVAFRRAFIEFRVIAGGKTFWVSGETDTFGVIGEHSRGFKPLATEFFENGKFQPHHEEISRENQVQIYEQLVADSTGAITTSFLSLKKPLKDNRLLPRGWKGDGPDAEATKPDGSAREDRDFSSGEGADTVRYNIAVKLPPNQPIKVSAVLYYQSIPPYYLRDRFKNSDGPATQSLFNFVGNLDLKGTEIENWKLKIAGDERQLAP